MDILARLSLVVGLLLIGAAIFYTKSAVWEIEGMIMLLIAAVLYAADRIVAAINGKKENAD
jgi:hypothetical protein